MKHTPGPWKVLCQSSGPFSLNGTTITDANGVVVASAQFNPPKRPHSTEQMFPNANLIAAAPEMYEICQRIHEPPDMKNMSGFIEWFVLLCNDVNQIIAKVEAYELRP